LRGFLLVLEGIEGILKENEGRFESLEGIGELGSGLESLEGILKASIGRLESLEERLKAAICESLKGRLKATIVIFNHHWRAKEVGS
jgi:hypothetical protein